MPSLSSPEPAVNLSSTTPLPAGAHDALVALAKDYFRFLEVYDRKLSNLVMIDLKDFVDASAADLDTDEALAVYLDCAPLFDAYMREIAFMAEYHVRLATAAQYKRCGVAEAAVRENVRAAEALERICAGYALAREV